MRPVTPQDYSEIQGWFDARGRYFDQECITEEGLIEPGVCAIWLYRNSSKVLYMDMFIANPEAPKSAVFAAGKAFIEHVRKDPKAKIFVGYSTSKLLHAIMTTTPARIEEGFYFAMRIENA